VGDTTQMAEACARLITDRALWSKQSAAAVERATSRFGIADIVSRYESVYGALV
jgi:glycosyltransferase involved in cell wall biosynthesis